MCLSEWFHIRFYTSWYFVFKFSYSNFYDKCCGLNKLHFLKLAKKKLKRLLWTNKSLGKLLERQFLQMCLFTDFKKLPNACIYWLKKKKKTLVESLLKQKVIRTRQVQTLYWIICVTVLLCESYNNLDVILLVLYLLVHSERFFFITFKYTVH